MDPVPEERFSRLVGEALDRLPPELAARFDNVAVIVEDANDEEPDILGLYEGVPLTDRWDYAGVLPDRISIYRLPLCSMCESEQELIEEVQITVVHEFAHHFGLDDDELHDLGWE